MTIRKCPHCQRAWDQPQADDPARSGCGSVTLGCWLIVLGAALGLALIVANCALPKI